MKALLAIALAAGSLIDSAPAEARCGGVRGHCGYRYLSQGPIETWSRAELEMRYRSTEESNNFLGKKRDALEEANLWLSIALGVVSILAICLGVLLFLSARTPRYTHHPGHGRMRL